MRQLLSRPAFQPFWLQLLKLCHAGMNYGGGQSVAMSGELQALAFVQRSLMRSTPLLVFDVGANGGAYLQAVFTVFGQDVRAYPFQPPSSSFLHLQSHSVQDP